jgi:hypothetical protein
VTPARDGGSGLAEAPVGGAAPRDTVIVEHLRGSSLMLAGRVAALGVAFVTQVIVVRHLSKGDYGAFAYAFQPSCCCSRCCRSAWTAATRDSSRYTTSAASAGASSA